LKICLFTNQAFIRLFTYHQILYL